MTRRHHLAFALLAMGAGCGDGSGPGVAARVQTLRVESRPVAVYDGGSWTPHFVALDADGNLLTDVDVRLAPGAHVASIASDGVVTMSGLGRGFVIGEAGAGRDTAWVSVVPHATLAVGGMAGKLADNGVREWDPVGNPGAWLLGPLVCGTGGLDWSPDGARLTYAGLVAPPGGTPLRVVPRSGDSCSASYDTRWSRDGQWLYYTAPHSSADTTRSLWRVHPDTTGREELLYTAGTSYRYPAPSPDGATVALSAAGQLVRVSLSTGVVTPLGVAGILPRYTRDGADIVFLSPRDDGRTDLDVVAATGGTGRTLLTQQLSRGTFGLTPDGAFAAVVRFPPVGTTGLETQVELVRLSNGEELPLPVGGQGPNSTNVFETAVKP